MARRKTRTTYRLKDGRVLQSVREDYPGGRCPMTFIKCGDDYPQVDELGRLAFNDDRLNAWLKHWMRLQ